MSALPDGTVTSWSIDEHGDVRLVAQLGDRWLTVFVPQRGTLIMHDGAKRAADSMASDRRVADGIEWLRTGVLRAREFRYPWEDDEADE